MIRDDLDPNTGLPLVQETRVKGGRWKALPKWAMERVQATDAPREGGAPRWTPAYLQWAGPTLDRLSCWKCGVDLFGWRPVLDQFGHAVERDGKACLWLRAYDHYTTTPVTVRWGVLNKLALFEAMRCKDCTLTDADAPMLTSIWLAGHTAMLDYAWAKGLPSTMGKHAWATYLYRWSDAAHIQCEPLGVHYQTKERAMSLPTAGKPIMPADWVQIGETLQASKFYPGMVLEYTNETPPPGWGKGPREGTIVKL